MSFKHLLFLLFISFISQNLYSQLSRTHYLPPITSGDEIENQYIYISTPKNQSFSFKIIPIGQPSGSEITGTVSNATPFVTSSPIVGNQLFQSTFANATVTTNKGYIIEADDVVYVSVRMRSENGFQAGAIVSKGNSAPGKEFRVGGFVNTFAASGYLTFASVMATEDNTQVTFDDLPTGIRINNYNGALPIVETLNEGETYIISVSFDNNGGNPNDLIGSLIKADKPIVVNSGSLTGSFHQGNGRDYGIDQIVDATKIGSEYIFVKGDGNNDWENVLIIAHEDNTEVTINGNTSAAPILLNRGEFEVIEGNFYNTNGNMYVKTTKPVFAYQGIGGLNDGSESLANQGMFFVPPLSCENRGDVNNIAQINRIGSDTSFTGGVSIVTNVGATVTINGAPIEDFRPQGPFQVDGNPNYETYRVEGLTNDVSVGSDRELYCAYFNYSGFATTGGFYSGFPSAPEINFNTTVSSLGSCIPNVTLEAANTDLFDSFSWEYFNETTNTWEIRSTNANYKPLSTEPGRYKLIGTVDCTGATFESTEIPVSICPDDFDGDLIIDNLDVDLDNDGILNCDESIGNATLNMVDINNPVIIFADGTNNATITSSIYTEDDALNDFIGQNNGNFTSTLNPGTSSNLKYELNFDQNINLKISQNLAENHTISEGEFFILKISPNSKNITLLDPDDQLLVDSNFDGEFESGVLNLSASEIHFQFKANLTGAESTFQFVANQVNQVSFEHKSVGIATASTFAGNLQLTCFSLDSDGDGIENMFDLDSDNDGIPDIYEASSSKITLLNTDANLDGLDDAFDGIATNIDTDNDGIPNYLDVDSDNDGIYDLVEAGHSGIDANNDGILDDAIAANVGENGLLNSLETAINSGILSYTLLDTDADDIFNFLELDADNDDCFDVTEAGFTGNNVGILNATPFAVDANGKVINNLDGYTTPNLDYITSAPIEIITPFEDVIFCENDVNSITINSTADGFLWQVSTDGTNWNNITTDAVYSDENTTTLQFTNVPLSYNNFKYRVVLTRTGNACAVTSNEINLTVNPLPIPQAEVSLLQCDDDLDRISTANLTEAEVSISANRANETFTYFATEADAIAGTPEVADKLRYPVNLTGEAWVRTIANGTGCYAISKINLQVEAAADVTYNREFEAVCDDFLQADGTNGTLNNDTDGITNFNFSEANDEILAFFNLPLRNDLEVSFYETNEDRTAVINEISDISNYRNTNFPSDITRQTIYFKITNKNNNDCNGTGELYLKTDPVPEANQVEDLILCDDINDGNNTNGIVQSFDLESQNTAILGTQNATDYRVTYHISAEEANTGSNEITSPYTNIVRDLQPIFVRVTNNLTGCFTDHIRFNLIVNPVPIANFVADLEVCDENSDGSARNGFSQSINLESQTATILGNQDPAVFIVTYHKSLAEAQTGNNPLVSPYTNTIPNEETIYVRILNSTTVCSTGISDFKVLVNPEPTFVPPTNLAYCDDNLDDDDTNGIIQNIDLDSKIVEILGTTQSPNDFNVTFHATQNEASLGDNAIASPYTNTTPTETIFVRIENKATLCVNDDVNFQLIVNPLPDFTVTTPQIICLNDVPFNIAVENPNDVYNYIWQDENGTVLNTTSTDNLNISVGGNYTVTATTTNGTNCSRTETIVVNESNPATLNPEFITIIDESNNISSQPDLSIFIDTTTHNLGIGDYQFAVINTDTNERFPFIGFQDEPLFENLEGGIYQVIVNDKNGCSPDATLIVSVLQFPKFFTPNGDGQNDTWVVKGANKTFYPNASINIFNRFGNLVAQIPIDGEGWNGMYQSKLLPSDDYWYNVTLIPADSTKPPINKKGNFSLLRR